MNREGSIIKENNLYQADCIIKRNMVNIYGIGSDKTVTYLCLIYPQPFILVLPHLNH